MKFGSSKLPGGKFWRYSILVFSLVWWNWLLPFSAFAAEARETVEIVITRGVLSSEKGDWAQAKTEFEKAVKLAPDSEQALTYLGQACYQVGDYEKSAQIFRQLLGKSPTKAEFHLSLGLALLKLGKKEDAQKEFDLAEAASEKQEKPRFWRIKLSTGTQYDSNLVLAPRDSELPGSVSHQWGIRQIFLGFGEISHSFSERVKSGLSYTYYQGLNIDLGQEDFNPREYDMLDNTFGFFASHEGKKYLARLNYSYDALLAGSSLDFYSQSHSVAPSLNYMINPSLVSYLGYEFRRDILHEPPTDPELMSQDGMSHALNLRQFVFFGPENRVTIAPEYRFKANLTAGSDYKYLGHRAGSSFDYRYLGARFSLAGAYEYRGFRNENTVQKNNGEWVKRRDDEISLRGSLGWAAKIWGVELGLNLTENFSNIEKYSYQRLLLMLGLNLTV